MKTLSSATTARLGTFAAGWMCRAVMPHGPPASRYQRRGYRVALLSNLEMATIRSLLAFSLLSATPFVAAFIVVGNGLVGACSMTSRSGHTPLPHGGAPAAVE